MTAPATIRVLVVDDSVVVRQVICDALRSEPGIEIAGIAQNGTVALERIASLKPDVVTLDLEMPELDGLAVLDALRQRGSRTPVVVFSTLSERGAVSTLEALGRGACDYLCKPSGQHNIKATIECIRVELVPKLRAACDRSRLLARRREQITRSLSPARPAATVDLSPPPKVGVIAIGVSTGGPAALAEIIPRLPRDLPPILIVQHMPKLFTRVMAERLAGTSVLSVREAVHGETLAGGTAYVAPGDYHLRVAGRAHEAVVQLDQEPQQNGCRPAVDPLFESVAAVYGRHALALVLTGLGHDGTRGASAIRDAGGQVWAQNESSSVAFGMPGSVIKAGLAHRTLPLLAIPRAIATAASASTTVSSEARRKEP